MLLIGSLISKFLIKSAVEKVLTEAVKSPNIPISKGATAPVAEAVATKITAEVNSIIENQTNQEPWYRSRVLLGSFSALMIAVGSLVQMLSDGEPNHFSDYWAQVVIIAPIMFAIYGRLFAGKAVGR